MSYLWIVALSFNYISKIGYTETLYRLQYMWNFTQHPPLIYITKYMYICTTSNTVQLQYLAFVFMELQPCEADISIELYNWSVISMCVALVVYVFPLTYSETLYLKRNSCTNVKHAYSVSKFCYDHRLKADGNLWLLWRTEKEADLNTWMNFKLISLLLYTRL